MHLFTALKGHIWLDPTTFGPNLGAQNSEAVGVRGLEFLQEILLIKVLSIGNLSRV